MAKVDRRVTCVEITQYLDKDYFSKPLMQKIIETKEVDKIGKCIVTLLNENMEVVECHCIIHDKDTREVWSYTEGNYVIETKEPHFHCFVKFKERTTIEDVSIAVGIEPQYVERPKTKGNYAWSRMLAYATHQASSDKHLYSLDEVWSYEDTLPDGTKVGVSYADWYAKDKRVWETWRVENAKKKAVTDLPRLMKMIDDYEITTIEQIELNDELYAIYVENIDKIEKRLQVTGHKRVTQTIQRLNAGELVKSVVFITGKAEGGKTYFAKLLAKAYIDKVEKEEHRQATIYYAASTNSFDDYLGQEIVILDDIDSRAIGNKDWLRLLDAENANGSLSARYRNKAMCPELLIITSTLNPYDYFNVVRFDENDALDQFIRRILMMVTVINTDKYLYNLAIEEKTEPKQITVSDSVKPVKVEHIMTEIMQDRELNDMIDKVVTVIASDVKPKDIARDIHKILKPEDFDMFDDKTEDKANEEFVKVEDMEEVEIPWDDTV